jgi:hypothetical protein
MDQQQSLLAMLSACGVMMEGKSAIALPRLLKCPHLGNHTMMY